MCHDNLKCAGLLQGGEIRSCVYNDFAGIAGEGERFVAPFTMTAGSGDADLLLPLTGVL